jgi:hypothetical protein
MALASNGDRMIKICAKCLGSGEGVASTLCDWCGGGGGAEVKFVPEELRKAADLYEQRNKIYGNNYVKFGEAVQPLLAGIQLNTIDDFNRYGVLTQILGKITRYCANFSRGGHDDSLVDMAVYAMMLLELDTEQKRKSQLIAEEL